MKEIFVDWADIKAFTDARNLSIQWLDIGGIYHLRAIDGNFILAHEIKKTSPAGSDQSDFETNYKDLGNKTVGIQETSGVRDPDGLRARLVGTHNVTVTKNTTQDIDWLIPDLTWSGSSKQCYFDGLQYYAENAKLGDRATFQVIDIDGVLYPAGTVLEEFSTNWYIMPDYAQKILLYKAKLIKDLYIRIKYTSTSTTTDVNFVCSLFRHLNENENL